MTFKVGDVVRECPEYVREHSYTVRGLYNRDLVRLGRGRFLVVAVSGDKVSVVTSRWKEWCEPKVMTLEEFRRKNEQIVPAAQLVLFPENKELEESYRETVNRVQPQIAECLRMATSAIEDAERLAEAHGIPFHGPSGLSQQYTPGNLPDLDPDTIEEITDCYPGDRLGWEQSAIC